MKDNLAGFTVLAVVVVVVISALSLHKLKFSFDLERFFPDGDEDLDFYMDFRDKFSPDNDFLLVGIKNYKGIFNYDFLNKLETFSDSLEKLDYVDRVISPTNVENLVIGPFGAMNVPYVHVNDTSKYVADSLRIYKEEKLLGVLFSANSNAVCVNVITEKSLSKVKSDSLLQGINRLLSQVGFEEVHLGGRIPSQAYVIGKMGSELSLFTSISFFILVLMLSWLYRSFFGVFLPMLIVVFSTVILLGVLVLINEDINLVATILPVVMFVVGISDVIHVLSRYSTEKIRLNSWSEALKITFKEVGLATLLTSVTTAIGFATLVTASIYPVQRFGIVMSMGVMIAFVVTFLLLPSILYLIKDKWNIMKGDGGEVVRLKLPAIWFDKIINNSGKIFAGFILIVGLSFFGINKLQVNNYLLDDLKENDPHMVDFKFFEKEFSGVRPFELALFSEKGLMNYEVQRELLKLENYLTNDFEANNIVSPLFFTKSINQALHGGNAQAFNLAEDETKYNSQKQYLKRFENQDFYQNYISADQQEGRISAKINDDGRIVVQKKINELNRFVLAEINPVLLKVKPTGTAILIDKNAEYLAYNMLQGLGIAFLVISVIVAVLFKSLRMVLISLVPNILPLLMIAGFMGFTGIDLKPPTIIIFTISFGIAVDDTIHFLSKLRLEMLDNKSIELALRNTFDSTGKAIVITSVILLSGFASLMFSTFQSTFYIGLLIGLTLLFAVISDLVLLPVLVRTFYRSSKTN